MKVLVLGAGGQLGSDLALLMPGAVALTRKHLSVADAPGLRAALERYRPEIVFNCAAYNPVDRAETEPEVAMSVNSDGAFNAAAACRSLGVGWGITRPTSCLTAGSTGPTSSRTRWGPWAPTPDPRQKASGGCWVSSQPRLSSGRRPC